MAAVGLKNALRRVDRAIGRAVGGVRVLVDGHELGPDLRVEGEALRWERTMAPGDAVTVTIGYATRGVEHFYYQIPVPREIRDFTLAMRVADLPLADVNYPEGCLTPSVIDEDGEDVVLRWELDRSLTTAGMGIALPRPVQARHRPRRARRRIGRCARAPGRDCARGPGRLAHSA